MKLIFKTTALLLLMLLCGYAAMGQTIVATCFGANAANGVKSNGTIYGSCPLPARAIQKYSQSGAPQGSITFPGEFPLVEPRNSDFSPLNGLHYVVSNNGVRTVSGGPVSGLDDSANDISIMGNGSYFVAYQDSVSKYNSANQLIFTYDPTVQGAYPINHPTRVKVNAANEVATVDGSNVLITDEEFDYINAFTWSGPVNGICWDPDGNLWLSSGVNVYKVTISGSILTSFGGSNFFESTAGLDMVTNLYVCDPVAHKILVISLSPLPVNLLYLTARLGDGGNAVLDWATAQELNNRGFQIQHSRDGKSWEDVRFVQGAGTTNDEQRYEETLPLEGTGNHYFRLEQVDFDGKTSLTPVRTVELLPDRAVVSVFPNPASSQVTVSFNQEDAEGDLRIFCPNGRLVAAQVLTDGKAELQVNNLPAGIYTVTVTGANGTSLFHERLVVN